MQEVEESVVLGLERKKRGDRLSEKEEIETKKKRERDKIPGKLVFINQEGSTLVAVGKL